MHKTALGAALAMVLSLTLVQSVQAKGLKGVINTNFDFGGDEMLKVTVSNNSDTEVKAGELMHINGGVSIPNDGTGDWTTEITLGYKFRRVENADGKLVWSRYPLELVEYRRVGNIRMGGGITYHVKPKIDGDGSFANADTTFDNAFGFVLQADYMLGEFNIGGRYTFIEYQGAGASINGNSVGLALGARF